MLIWFQRGRMRVIEKEREDIEGEERRMFDFLHGLGESLQEDASQRNMHRFIVDGVSNVVGAQFGALYLLDKTGTELVPVCISHGAPPLVAPPLSVIQEALEKPDSLDNYLKLAPANLRDGILGEVLTTMKPQHTRTLGEHPALAGFVLPSQEKIAVMAAPLIYGKKEIGVLAVSRNSGQIFTVNDFDVFSSAAEQSSFALGSALIHEEAHEKRRLEEELRNASEIQKILLPKKPPSLADYRLAGANCPAKLVSGDYYDYVPVDTDHFGAVIADVCGKGIPASLIMASCRSVLRVNAKNNHSAAQVLHAVNHQIFPDIREDMFVSLAYIILERGSNRVVMARAGHEPPLLYRSGSASIETIRCPGLVAGIDSGEVFERTVQDYSFEMNKGDVLLLYTDGVTEAMDAAGGEYGVERLKNALTDSASRGANAVVKSISAALEDFMEGCPQSDDITLIAIEKR